MNLTIDEIRNKIVPILPNYGIKQLAIFGSVVRGESTEDSDIDILVEFKDKENKTLLDLVGFELDIAQLLHHKVDVLTYASIHPLLKEHILQEQEILYAERP